MSKSFFQIHGQKMLDNGYDIIPIVPKNKYPAIEHWETVKPNLAAWLKMPPLTGIGIRTQNTPAIDVDVRDGDVSKKMLDFLKDQFGQELNIRIGQVPKFLMLTQTPEAFKKMRSKKYIDLFGFTHQIEILGDGQQFVSYGIHPETQQHFKWNETRNPSTTPKGELPTLTPEIAQKIIDHFESLVPDDWHVITKAQESKLNQENRNPLLNLKPALNVSDEKVRHEVNLIDPDITHDEWVKVGMGLYHQYEGSDEGFEIWDTWSQAGEKYNPDIMRIKWHSFEPTSDKVNPVTFASVMRMTADVTTKPSTDLYFKSAAEVSRNIGSIKWLIRGWLEAETMSCVFGEPGSFKSFVAIDQACCIATGIEWQGCEVDQGVALYVAGEGHAGIGRRVLAWCTKHQIAPEKVPVYFSTAAADLFNSESAVELTLKIEEILDNIGEKVKVIYFDTLARNIGAGDENSTTDMNKFINHIDKYIKNKYDCSVVLVHHTGHKDKHRARGSSAFLGALDHNIRCNKLGTLAATLTATKMKDAPEPQPLYLEGQSLFLGQDDDGNEMNSLVFEKGQPPVKAVLEPTDKQKQLLDIIQTLAEGNDGVCRPINKTDLYRQVESDGMYERGRRAAPILKKLEEKGFIDTTDEIIKLKQETTDE